ncbi:MAG: GGDEF domain-containing protein [Pseudohongiellaceae bacterium]
MNNDTHSPAGETVDTAQRLRLHRTYWGFGYQLFTLFLVAALVLMGMLPASRVPEFLALVVATNLVFVVLIRSGVNLRFKDPSLTAGQIVAALWPSLYIMFFVTDPQARTAFLFLGTGGLLFGMFGLRRRDMLLVGTIIVLAYVALLLVLQQWAPERINWRVEVLIVYAYAVVVLMVGYIGSHIAGMRHQLKEQNRRLEVLATRDPLTRLPNRRSLLTQLSREIGRSERRAPDQDALCVSMLDIDHFKEVNDSFGHDVGDTVLCRISEALQNILREGDFIGRFGGEEFVLVLPETTLEAAQAVAERVRATVEGLVFEELPDGKRVTVSQGVAWHHSGESIDRTLKRADEALYQAKSEGRNRIVTCT